MTIRTSPPRLAPFDRLGGVDGLERAVLRLFGHLARDEVLSRLVPAGDAGEARWQIQILLTELLGGPMVYDGPDPASVARNLGIEPTEVRRLIEEVVASFADQGLDDSLAADLRARLEEFAARHGFAPVAPAPTPDPPSSGLQGLVAQASFEAARAGVGDWNLFVLDPELTVVHLSPEAARAVRACEGELRRAFNIGVADLPGASILRFHPAPSQLQRILRDATRLPHETTWCFGHTVWKAHLFVLRGPAGHVEGYVVAWRDESEAHRSQAAFQRLRGQAEELPIPVMFPGPTLDHWFGNAACQLALTRLAPYLSEPVGASDGIPVSLFFPDGARRVALFRDPALLPHKERITIGPETIAILVTAVLDQEQRFLGPQITWEIVHHAIQPAAAALAPPVTEPVAPAPPEPLALTRTLRDEARTLEAASMELNTVVRLLDAVADQAEHQTATVAGMEPAPLPEALRLVEAAAAALAAARAAGPSSRREEAGRALEAITEIARRTNCLALEASLLAIGEEAAHAASALEEETRALAAEVTGRVRGLCGRAQASAEILRQAVVVSQHVEQLRDTLAEPESPR